MIYSLPRFGNSWLRFGNRAAVQTPKMGLALLLGAVLLMFGLHFALWGWTIGNSDTDWLSMLLHWDANFYSLIVREGYDSEHYWAFLPFYPLCVKGFAWLTGLLARSQLAGTLMSSLLFLGWAGWLSLQIAFPWRDRRYLQLRQSFPSKSGNLFAPTQTLPYLLPQTWLGWVCFVYSPGSFVFHSHHTESLFLVLSFLAFWGAARGRWRSAALLAGLCVATRNQGVFVIFTVALLSASMMSSWLGKLRRFLFSHLLSLPFLLAWLGYQYWQTGNPLLSFQVQKNWAHATSFFSILQTFWFGNPWQNTNLGSILHHIVFFLLLLAAIWLWRHARILSLYVALSLTVMPLQGELVNSFRFGSVLFPAWFLLGDRLSRSPLWFKLGLLACLIFLNLMVTRNYAINRWAY